MQDVCNPERGESWKYRDEVDDFFLNSSKATPSSVSGLEAYLPAADFSEKIVDVLEIVPSEGNASELKKKYVNCRKAHLELNATAIVERRHCEFWSLSRYSEAESGLAIPIGNLPPREKSFFEIKKTKSVHTYIDGTREEKQYVTQDQRPQTNGKINPVFLLVPALSAILMSGIILKRRGKR